MENSEVKKLIADALPGAEVTVTGGDGHYEARVIWSEFDGKLPVARQKMVYATLGEHITSGALHALTIKAYTPEQWAQASKFQVGSA